MGCSGVESPRWANIGSGHAVVGSASGQRDPMVSLAEFRTQVSLAYSNSHLTQAHGEKLLVQGYQTAQLCVDS